MNKPTQTISVLIKEASIASAGSQSVFAFKFELLTPVCDMDQGSRCFMSIFGNYLPGRHDLARMALARPGEVIDFELTGLEMRMCEADQSNVFVEFDNIKSFKVYKPAFDAFPNKATR